MEPRVWGIGLTRTGTSSLNAALRQLGYNSVHWPTTHALLYGNLEAATDESVAAVFPYLDRRYPGSKFILTDRDEDRWIESTAKHRGLNTDTLNTLLRREIEDLSPAERDRWVEFQFTQMALYGSVEFNEPKFRAGFRRYHEKVSEYFEGREPTDLLRLRICDGEGWDRLCAFLGKTKPSLAFPRANAARMLPTLPPHGQHRSL